MDFTAFFLDVSQMALSVKEWLDDNIDETHFSLFIFIVSPLYCLYRLWQVTKNSHHNKHSPFLIQAPSSQGASISEPAKLNHISLLSA